MNSSVYYRAPECYPRLSERRRRRRVLLVAMAVCACTATTAVAAPPSLWQRIVDHVGRLGDWVFGPIEPMPPLEPPRTPPTKHDFGTWHVLPGGVWVRQP